MTLGWLVAFATCLAVPPTKVSKQVAALATQRDPSRLEAAAVAVARSGDVEAIHKLATHLGTRSFLRRLDPGKGDESDIDRLLHVFAALTEHPNAATEALCISLAHNAEFVSLPERLNPLLNALGAVRPTSQEGVAIFRETSHSDYFGVNGPVLARNASPRALAVLEELMSDQSIDSEDRVDVAHRSLLPVRTNPAVVEMCARLTASTLVESRVRMAIVETLFDYQARRWFGVAMNQPVPPPWSSATEAGRNALTSLGKQLLSQPDVPANLRAQIQKTLTELH
jgi:hypothetical protein